MRSTSFNSILYLTRRLGRIGRIVMRNAILVEGIEVVAVNEYVTGNLVVDVKLIYHCSPFIDLDYMVRVFEIQPEMHT